jgi:hypothetical protein
MSYLFYKLSSTFSSNVRLNLPHICHNSLPLKYQSFDSFLLTLKQICFSSKHLHRRYYCTQQDTRLTTFVGKTFDTRSRSDLYSNHHLWYHCWVMRRQPRIIRIWLTSNHTSELDTTTLPKILSHLIYGSSYL